MPMQDWMHAQADTPRSWARRSRGRRSADRRTSVEAVLIAGVFLAWAWGAFEVARLFVR